ncbi:MAG: hypothetical protein P9L92_03505 [Candidatus Electryonea clarkiae]|nr:hypothetical protein [Candidatus Electryonea clarkiae]MDP8287445.1 hypothetical protein [Candidatus Electryonea clarkiae]
MSRTSGFSMSKGHQVETYIRHNREIDEQSKILTGIGTTWSQTDYKKVQQRIQQFKPDIVHVNIFFTYFSLNLLCRFG